LTSDTTEHSDIEVERGAPRKGKAAEAKQEEAVVTASDEDVVAASEEDDDFMEIEEGILSSDEDIFKSQEYQKSTKNKSTPADSVDSKDEP